MKAYIGFSSNINIPFQQIAKSYEYLCCNPDIDLMHCSYIYETKPLGPPQPNYLNAAAEIETSLPPHQLYKTLKAIEQLQNHEKRAHWGPRSIDLDLLLYDDNIIETEELTIPHRGILKRDFVLIPLRDINPNLIIPPNIPIQQALENLSERFVIQSYPKTPWPIPSASTSDL